MAKLLILKHFVPSHTKLTAANVRKFPFLEFSPRWELATRSRRRAPPTIIFWASLINLEFAATFILSIETLDCRIPFRDIAHRNEPKAARLAGFAIHNQFDFRNSAERLKEFPQCAFCHVKGKISDVKLHGDSSKADRFPNVRCKLGRFIPILEPF